MDHHLAFSGLLQAPLNPLKTDVSRGPPGLSGGPGPIGPYLNSTTANIRRQAFTKATGQLTYKCCHLVSDCESDSFVTIAVITKGT